MTGIPGSRGAPIERYYRRMDRSWRFVLPVRYRQVSTRWVFCSDQAECLTLLPASAWTRRLEAIAAQASSGRDKMRLRLLVATGIEIDLDRRGRLAVPPLLRHRLKGPNLLVIGVVDKVEVTSAILGGSATGGWPRRKRRRGRGEESRG